MNKKTTKLHHSKLSNDLMNYINNNINTDINIDQLSIEYGISKCHFHKIFKEYTGSTIYQFIKAVRLQKASNTHIVPHRPRTRSRSNKGQGQTIPSQISNLQMRPAANAGPSHKDTKDQKTRSTILAENRMAAVPLQPRSRKTTQIRGVAKDMCFPRHPRPLRAAPR